jgi:hypothetical protein
MAKTLRVFTAAALVCAAATTSQASITRVGATTLAIAATTRGSSAAYDSINHVYLVVSAQGIVWGRFIDKNGVPLGTQFVIQANPALFSFFPRVTFSPDANGGAGGFLVTWSEEDIKGVAFLHGRMVAFGANGPYGTDNVLSTDGLWFEAAPYAAYSKSHHEFLVVYRTNGTYIVRGIRVDNAAAALGAIFTISQTNLYEDLPSVAYNPVTDRYLVCWKGFSDAGSFGFVDCRFVAGGTNNLIGTTAIRLRQSVGTWITDTTYNPTTNQFLVTWRDASAGIASTMGRIVAADGTLPGGPFPISTLWQAYDGLGVAYNTLTKSFFAVSHCANCHEDGGVELADSGQPLDSGLPVTSTVATGNFYPQIAASSDDPNWLVSTATSFAQTSTQLLAGTGGAPPAAPPNPMMWVDGPGSGIVTQPFDVEGWAIDLGSPTGTGADAIHVLGWPAGGGPPVFAGATTPSIARGDIGAIFGSRFTNSGYRVTVNSLPAGTYVLAVYMRSTVTNTFNAVRTVTITVSKPLIAVDTPAPNATVAAAGFFLGGWAVDLASPSGPGVNTIHVWAFPVGGGSPIAVGVPVYGIPRPDLGAFFGSQFTNAGYGMVVTTLSPGTYDLAVFSQSAVTGTFNAVRVVRVVVQ